MLSGLGEHVDEFIGAAAAVPPPCLKMLPNEEEEQSATSSDISIVRFTRVALRRDAVPLGCSGRLLENIPGYTGGRRWIRDPGA